jgi:hypothetical protein
VKHKVIDVNCVYKVIFCARMLDDLRCASELVYRRLP